MSAGVEAIESVRTVVLRSGLLLDGDDLTGWLNEAIRNTLAVCEHIPRSVPGTPVCRSGGGAAVAMIFLSALSWRGRMIARLMMRNTRRWRI